jgi:hypothetical protein
MNTTFKSFLIEGPKFNLEKFKKDCAPFLTTLKKSHGSWGLYHGTKNYPDDFRIVDWKPRSGPRDSDREMHRRVNEFFVEKFGAPIRDWLFTSSNPDMAQLYAGFRAPICEVFPIGNFEWLQGDHADLHDMTGWHSRMEAEIKVADKDNKISYDERSILATNYMINKMRHMKWRFNTDLETCLQHDNEIMIKCDKFYLVKWQGPAFDAINEYLTSGKD